MLSDVGTESHHFNQVNIYERGVETNIKTKNN